jgi:phosphate starvation-inducible protein PhoH and related proteins
MAGAETLPSFAIDLPHQEAALALAGEAEATLHRLEALTGASLVLRGLQLVIQGNPPPPAGARLGSGGAASAPLG